MTSHTSWAFAPIVEVTGALLILTIGAPLWSILAGSPFELMTREEAFSISLAPFFGIPTLTASLITISSRPQWTLRSRRQRLILNTVLFLSCVAAFPLLYWNLLFWPTLWLFGIFSVQLVGFLSTPAGVTCLAVGAFCNVVVTFVVNRLRRQLNLTPTNQSLAPACITWIVYLGLMFGPFLLSTVFELSPLVTNALGAGYALYLGALLPALWPHFLINSRVPMSTDEGLNAPTQYIKQVTRDQSRSSKATS